MSDRKALARHAGGAGHLRQGHSVAITDAQHEPDSRDSFVLLHARAGNDAVSRLIGGGMPIPDHVREEMEARFGADFRNVRIHNDAASHTSAAALNAKAYAHREDVVFGDGRFAPDSFEGKRLLAHELAHVLQQRHSRSSSSTHAGGSVLEANADAAADAALCSADSKGGHTQAASLACASAATAPAIQCAPDDELEKRAKRDADLDVANSATINILYATSEAQSIDELLQAGLTVEGYFLNATGPRTRVAAAKTLQDIRAELKSRETTAERDPDGALLKKDLRGAVPWTEQRPKRVEDIYPFAPALAVDWVTLSEEPAGGTRTDLPRASQRTERPASTEIGTHVSEPQREVTEETSAAPGPEILRGLAELDSVTVGDALGEAGDLFDQRTGALPPEVAGMSLLRACSRVLFIANRVYLLDRSGHIAPGEFRYDLEWSSMDAGATYFFSKYWLQGAQSEELEERRMVEAGAPEEAKDAESGPRVNLLMRIDSGKPQTQQRDLGLRHVNVGMVPLMSTLQAIVSSGAGVGVIVSSQFDQRQLSFSKDFDPVQAWKAVRGARQYLGWAIRSRLRMAGADPAGEVANALLGAAIDRLAALAPEAGPALLGVQALQGAAWLGEIGNIASYAQTEDEINIASQEIARSLVEFLWGEITARIANKGVGKALEHVAGGEAERLPTIEAPLEPGQRAAQRQPGRRSEVTTEEAPMIESPMPAVAAPTATPSQVAAPAPPPARLAGEGSRGAAMEVSTRPPVRTDATASTEVGTQAHAITSSPAPSEVGIGRKPEAHAKAEPSSPPQLEAARVATAETKVPAPSRQTRAAGTGASVPPKRKVLGFPHERVKPSKGPSEIEGELVPLDRPTKPPPPPPETQQAAVPVAEAEELLKTGTYGEDVQRIAASTPDPDAPIAMAGRSKGKGARGTTPVPATGPTSKSKGKPKPSGRKGTGGGSAAGQPSATGAPVRASPASSSAALDPIEARLRELERLELRPELSMIRTELFARIRRLSTSDPEQAARVVEDLEIDLQYILETGLSRQGLREGPLDARVAIADARIRRRAAQVATAIYKQRRRTAAQKPKGGPIKGVYNAQEAEWIRARQIARPDVQLLRSTEVAGVVTPDGKTKTTLQIVKAKRRGPRPSGRKPDFVEIEGDNAVLGELKSSWEINASLSGGPGTASGGETQILETSKLGHEWAVEDLVIAYARRNNGEIVITGYDVATGERVTRQFRADQVGRSLYSYDRDWGFSQEYDF